MKANPALSALKTIYVIQKIQGVGVVYKDQITWAYFEMIIEKKENGNKVIILLGSLKFWIINTNTFLAQPLDSNQTEFTAC